MPRPKTLEDYTFVELVQEATEQAHGALLEQGGRGLKSSIHMWMSTAIRWHIEQQRQEAEAKASAKRKKIAGRKLRKLLR